MWISRTIRKAYLSGYLREKTAGPSSSLPISRGANNWRKSISKGAMREKMEDRNEGDQKHIRGSCRMAPVLRKRGRFVLDRPAEVQQMKDKVRGAVWRLEMIHWCCPACLPARQSRRDVWVSPGTILKCCVAYIF